MVQTVIAIMLCKLYNKIFMNHKYYNVIHLISQYYSNKYLIKVQ